MERSRCQRIAAHPNLKRPEPPQYLSAATSRSVKRGLPCDERSHQIELYV